MKKSTILSAILLTATLLAGCSGDKPQIDQPPLTDHTHAFGEWKTVEKATCDKAGSQKRTCTCGETEEKSLEKLPHTLTAGICTLCGYIDERQLLEFATMQLVTLQELPNGTYSVKSTELGTTAKQLAIPAEYEGKKITAIADNAFTWNENLTSITLPDSITTIGKSAFESCTALRSITLPDGVTEIGERAFYNCKKLTKLEIPVATGKIGKDIFTGSGITTLTVAKGNLVYHSANNAIIHTESKTLIRATKKTTEIPDDGSVTVIGSGAFYGIWGISKLTIPEVVTEIGAEAFYGCGDLLNLYLPSGLTKIGESITAGAKEGETLHIHYNKPLADWSKLAGNISWCDTDGYRVILHGTDESLHLRHDHKPTGTYSEEATCTKNGKEVYACVCGDQKEVTVPELGHEYYAVECTRCGEKAPDGYFLEYELLPDGTWAVVGNGGWLKTDVLVIPGTYQGKPVTLVAKDAFDLETSYVGLIIEEGIRIIEEGAFQNCYDLTFVQLPKSLQTIGKRAFASCRVLPELSLPDGLTQISDNAFAGCSKLKTVTLPASVRKIGDSAFSGCSAMTEITIPVGVTEIGASAFKGCRSLTELVIPDSVTAIGTSAFENCEGLQSLTLSKNVKTIGESLISRCESLKSLTLPASVSKITGEYVFYNSAISLLIIENPNIRIDSVSFNGMGKLKEIRFNGTLAEWDAVGNNFASSAPTTVTVYCTDGNTKIVL